MSFEGKWALARMPSLEDVERHLADIVKQGGLLAGDVEENPHGGFDIVVRFPVQDAERIPILLDDHDGLDPEHVRRDLDPPTRWDDELPSDEYRVLIDVVSAGDEDPPSVGVFSNEADNRAAWPVVCEIAIGLARRLGVLEEAVAKLFDVPDEQLN